MTIRDFSLVHRGRTFDLTMDFDMDQHAEWWVVEHFNHGNCYEPDESHVMFRAIRPGDTVIDVGANAGFFTVLMSKLVGPEGKVYSFEPGVNTLPSLRRNIELNKLTNVTLDTQPLWCREEEVTFHLSADTSGGNALWDPGLWIENQKTRAKPHTYTMMAKTLDSLNLTDVRLIKIDTEGADQKILEGAAVLLETVKPPFILVELNPFGSQQMGTNDEEFREYMRDFGYEAFIIYHEGYLPALVPRQTKLKHSNDLTIMNLMFSTLDAVAEAWPSAPYE